MPRFLPSAVIACVTFVAGVPARAADVADPPARAVPGDTTTDYGGVRVPDPYRSLEDERSDATRAWVDAQGRDARRRLDALPARRAVRAEYDAIDAEQPPTPSLPKATRAGTLFHVERSLRDPVGRLHVRPADGADRALLATDGSDRASVSGYGVSDDGRRLAVITTDAAGTRLEVRDATSGTRLGPATPGAWTGAAPVFTRDGRAVVYVATADDVDPTRSAAALRLSLRMRRIGDGTVTTLLGWNAGHGPSIDEKDLLVPQRSADGKVLYAVIRSAPAAPLRLVSAPLDRLSRDPASAPWTTAIERDAEVRAIALRGSQVFATTASGALRYRIVRYDTRRPTTPPREIVAEQAGVIEGLAVASDGLYYTVRTGYESTVHRVGERRGEPVRAALPFAGAVVLLDADPARPGVIASLEGWTHRKRFLRVRGTAVDDLSLVRGGSGIGADWTVDHVPCDVADPAQTPMIVVYRNGLVRDGSHPLIINGYGGYGYLEPAYFFPKLEPWIRRGGVFVDVTPRGGGGTGETSHRLAMGPTKPNTWRDVIACAETLVARGYTSAARTAVQGTGIGGLMAGRAITERPDLFRASVIRSGITDPLRYMEMPMHAEVDEQELGDAKTDEGVRSLLAASTYHHIEDGVRYPAVLLTTGLKDRRFAPWMAMKTAARFAAVATDRPAWLRVDPDGALGAPVTPAQRNDEAADRLAFLLWSLGVPEDPETPP